MVFSPLFAIFQKTTGKGSYQKHPRHPLLIRTNIAIYTLPGAPVASKYTRPPDNQGVYKTPLPLPKAERDAP